MTKSRILLYLLFAFICGVFMRSFFELAQSFYFLATIFSLLLLFLFYKEAKIIVFSCIVLCFVFGAWKTNLSLEIANTAALQGKAIEETAIIENVAESSLGQNLLIKLSGKKVVVLLKVPRYPVYQYGEEINIACTLETIKNIDDSFDYRMYMAKEGVLYSCEKAKYNSIAKNKGNFLFQKILEIRSSFEEKILQVIPQPAGALADGLLFGGSASLSKEIQNNFSRTGMTHIVAVSGYNVTIIAEYLIMLGIFIGLWRKQAIWFAIAGIILFVVMSGLPASAVRAGVMGGVLLWAMKNGRLANAENAVVFAAAIMLFLNPLLLRYDVGFQLSFLATLGIVLTSSFWEKSFIKKHKAFGISETIAMSLSAQIFVFPIIAYNFHLTSLISLLANILVLPVIPFSMLLVFLTSLFGFIFIPLSFVVGWLAYFTLFYELQIIHLLAAFPWASIEIKSIGPWWIAAYYVALICLLKIEKIKSFYLTLICNTEK